MIGVYGRSSIDYVADRRKNPAEPPGGEVQSMSPATEEDPTCKADWGAAGVSAVGDECQRKPGQEEEGRALSVTSCDEKGADDLIEEAALRLHRWRSPQQGKGSDCGEQATAEEEYEERKCRSHRKGREDVTPSKGV
ncbi:hypothetical protein B296_00025685 [Ensete ventricosum]|uniref:Uncharacterized protein n=1 Tax=Ensete ventricosum TaxID=4639 RepID=A0A426XWS7_ENSVE|nr:hypothetical protein B296_00025685 [Ensete ventricosum]